MTTTGTATGKSKQEYLSKYYDDNPKNKKKKHKKEKKSKKQKKEQGLVLEGHLGNELIGVDFHHREHHVDDDDDDNDLISKDSDGPVIVEENVEDPVVPLSSTSLSKGQWTVENTQGKGEASPLHSSRSRRRYDSDDDDRQPTASHRSSNRPLQSRRYDSEDDDGGVRDSHNKQQHENSVRIKQEAETARDDHKSKIRIKKEEESHDALRRRRKRYDSSDDDYDDEQGRDAHHRKRKRLDSDESGSDLDKGNRKRFDSDDNSNRSDGRPQRRKRHDSDTAESDDHPRRRAGDAKRRHDSDSDTSSDHSTRREKMQSGHDAGLQSGSKFSQTERKIQTKRQEQVLETVHKHGMGDTVHRDEFGRKVKEPVQDKKNNNNKQRRQLTPQEQLELNTGRVQKERQEAEQRYMEYLQQSTFARHAGDEGLEAMRKSVIREGDPMAQQAAKHLAANSTTATTKTTASQRRVYKGPPAKPNRYGILPGFRWDGVDRGNGYEDKLLAQKYSEQHKKEQAYRYSSADM